MRYILALLVPALTLAGCASGPGLQSRLAVYIGAPEQKLVLDLGVPARQISVNGVDYLAYPIKYQVQTSPGGPYWGGAYYYQGGPFWGPYGGFSALPADVQIWSCEATFAVVQGKVESFALRGNDCG